MGQQKILLIEDSLETQLVMKAALTKAYRLELASSGAEAQRIVDNEKFDLILLDVGLPDVDGFELYTQLRNHPNAFDSMIVFLTGRKETEDKVHGFSLGADDYIVKPVETREFQARIDAKMRKLQKSIQPQTQFKNGDFELDLAAQKAVLRRGGTQSTEVTLTTIEFKLLYYFLSHEGQKLAREEILKDVWGANVHITDRTVDTHVYTLRQKLGDHAVLIKSIPKVGYMYSPQAIKSS